VGLLLCLEIGGGTPRQQHPERSGGPGPDLCASGF